MKAEYDFSKAKRGAVIEPAGKTRITIYIDDEVLAAFRARAEAEGRGYQTLINEALKISVQAGDAPLTLDTLRKILREELHAAA
ncbi:MAG: BrnA antitoxin family protein [Pseudomonadota bacterium]